MPTAPHMQHKAPRQHTGEHEPIGPGYRTRETTHRGGRQVNRSQVAQDTAHTKENTEPTHR